MSPLDAFSRVRVLCIGDVMLDRFIAGTVKRISPESPVPVLSVSSENAVPGGAANVARNIAAQGGHCTLIGVVGQDGIAEQLRQALDKTPLITSHLIAAPGRPTTEKVRFVAHGQHMLRTDTENASAISPETERLVLDTVSALVERHQVVVLSDYAKGLLTDAVVRGVIELAREHGKPVIVDPKSIHIERYAGATIITPNAKEVLDASGIDPSENDEQAVQAGQLLLRKAALSAVLVTRAHRGMTLVTADGVQEHIKASAREVFDVVGAGDTVVATLALSLGAGQAVTEAARLANLAAGIVVGKRGTATVSHSELLEELQRNGGHGGLRPLEDKVLSIEDAMQMAESWRQDGYQVGFTNGCFDILHVGHLAILNYSKSQCGRLIVGVNSDASVKRLKGPERPINGEIDRAMLLAGLSAVDAVVVFDEDTPLEVIRKLQPDVLVKGADYTVDNIVGAPDVLARGGRVVTCPLIPDRSTSRVVEKLRKAPAASQS
ncbi:MAG: D-glycero-beta-D-manno-heptose-7-phosphate kinase [Pseudomonadota bacterium]